MFAFSRGAQWPARRTLFRTYASQAGSTKNSTSINKVTAAVIAGSSVAGGWYLSSYLNREKAIEVPGIPRLDRPNGELPFQLPSALTPKQVTEILTKESFEYSVTGTGQVEGYSGTRIPSNSPVEDTFVHGKLKSPWEVGKDWMVWGVFDGHGGWETSDLLTRELVPAVQHEVSALSPSAESEYSAVEDAIKSAFLKLDAKIIQDPAADVNNNMPFCERVPRLFPGFAGSCALLSLYDPNSRLLRVACTGDSRAVMGQQASDGSWETIPLSKDQTPRNPEEREKLNNEHPDEPDMLANNRVLGLAVSRAFGDGTWKWDKETLEAMHTRFEYRRVPRHLKSPPYLTAEPVVTTTEIKSDRTSFVIMASDGFWDLMSNEQAVDLVAKWLDWKASGGKQSEKNPNIDRPPFDFAKYRNIAIPYDEADETFEDKNPAVHLARNAFGGLHHNKISGILSYTPSRSRSVRDDMTLQVIFFKKDSG